MASDTLLTRIAAAIDRRYNDEAIGHTYEVCLHAADAVIRELGMREERWKSDDPTMLRGHWTRFVTDWTHPDV